MIFKRAACLATALIVLSPPVAAAESPWTHANDSTVRLLSGTVPFDGKDRTVAGVQIRMDQGWKTYWRNPGDSGAPPSFDWSGSKNLKRAEVLYPAPHRFADANGAANGYADEVVFPVLLTPARAGEPIALKLKLFYGLCKDLCIPNEANLALEVPAEEAASGGEAVVLSRFLDLVPRPAKTGELPAVSRVEAKLDGPSPELQIDALFPADASGPALFIDTPDAYVPAPKPVGAFDGGKQRFVAAFASAEEAAKIKGKPLTLTLVSDRGARATTWTVN